MSWKKKGIKMFLKRCNKYNGLIALQGMLLLMCGITCFTHGLNIGIGIVFFLFQFWGIFVPGIAACLMGKVDVKTDLAFYAWGYAGGLVLLLIQYFLLVPFGLSKYMLLLSVVISIISVYTVYRYKDQIEIKKDRKDSVFCLVCIGIIMLIGLFTVSFENSLPNETGGTGYYVDWLFWIGNNISLTKGFPMQDFRLVGTTFNYHYFSSILIAAIHLITKIDTVVLSFYYSYLIPAVLLVMSGYVLFTSLKLCKIYLYLGMVLLLFTEGSTISYVWHIYFCPFGYDYGYIFGMLSVAVLIKMLQAEQKEMKDAILAAICLGMSTGCKGPVGVVVLMGYGVFAFLLLCQKEWKKGLGYGVLWLASFVFVYFVFISGAATSADSSSGLKYLGLTEAWRQNHWAQSIYYEINEKYGISGSKFMSAVSLWLYNYRANKSGMILLIIGVITWIYKFFKGKMDSVLLILITICAWGILLTNVTKQSGGSQMYFIMSTIPFAILVGMIAIQAIRVSSKMLLNFVMAIVVIAGSQGIATYWNGLVIPKGLQGWRCISGKMESSGYAGYYVSEKDYEAYEWIKNHISNDAKIAMDCFVDSEGRITDQIVGVFTEKYIWNDGKYSVYYDEVKRRKEIVERVFDGDMDALKILADEEVEYLVQTLSVNPDFAIDEEFASCVYKNDSYAVYKIQWD